MTVITEPEAEHEWNEAVDWYDQREPGVGLRFNAVVRDYLKELAAQPERFPLVGRLTRKAKIKDWPYSIFFVVDDEQRQIKIVAVWHGKRNPAELRRRLR